MGLGTKDIQVLDIQGLHQMVTRVTRLGSPPDICTLLIQVKRSKPLDPMGLGNKDIQVLGHTNLKYLHWGKVPVVNI
jgi:hypothetical protein